MGIPRHRGLREVLVMGRTGFGTQPEAASLCSQRPHLFSEVGGVLRGAVGKKINMFS